MHDYEHKRLIQAITKLDEVPADSKAFSEWIEAEAHLDFLRRNAARLDAAQVPYDKEDKTIALLEKLLRKTYAEGDVQKLVGLRTVQLLRSKAKGHASGREAQQLAQDALMEHGTFANHFQHVCAQVADELETIEKWMS